MSTTYADSLLSLVEKFRHRRCERCGWGADQHVYTEDIAGLAYAWCLSSTPPAYWEAAADVGYIEALSELARNFGPACPHCGRDLSSHIIAIGDPEQGDLYPDPWCPEEYAREITPEESGSC